MLTDDDVKNFIKELKKEIKNCSPDKYGYVESDVYKKVIKRLKEYKNLSTKEEYRKFYIAEFKKMLKDTKEEYKDDPQGLKLFTMGYKEMIKQLEEK